MLTPGYACVLRVQTALQQHCDAQNPTHAVSLDTQTVQKTRPFYECMCLKCMRLRGGLRWDAREHESMSTCCAVPRSNTLRPMHLGTAWSDRSGRRLKLCGCCVQLRGLVLGCCVFPDVCSLTCSLWCVPCCVPRGRMRGCTLPGLEQRGGSCATCRL